VCQYSAGLLCSVINQKSAVLVYFVADALKRAAPSRNVVKRVKNVVTINGIQVGVECKYVK
jgi:hypothetical protein